MQQNLLLNNTIMKDSIEPEAHKTKEAPPTQSDSLKKSEAKDNGASLK